MEYKKKEYRSYHLHMIKTNKFKEISIRIAFREKLEKDKITIRTANTMRKVLELSKR